MRHLGTVDGGIITSGGMGIRVTDAAPARINDAAIASGNAFLVSELEKRDPMVRKPLTSVTYTRDIPVKVGGGWVETISSLYIDFGVSGGSGNGLVQAPGANGVPVIQANIGKDKFGTHVFSTIMRIGFIDMQRQQITGQSLDRLLTEGIRLAYDKHMDANVYLGLSDYGTTGLVNNANITAANVATNGAQSPSRLWTAKTADQILYDVNELLQSIWAAAGYDLDGMPNHLLLPYAQYTHIATTKVSEQAEKTILDFLLENNIAKKNGKELVVAGCRYCAGAGAGNPATDRMVAYVHDDRFLAVEELVPMSRTMTSPNTQALAYDSVYMANISEVELFYLQTMQYRDGI
jgi:hypothetical protein